MDFTEDQIRHIMSVILALPPKATDDFIAKAKATAFANFQNVYDPLTLVYHSDKGTFRITHTRF